MLEQVVINFCSANHILREWGVGEVTNLILVEPQNFALIKDQLINRLTDEDYAIRKWPKNALYSIQLSNTEAFNIFMFDVFANYFKNNDVGNELIEKISIVYKDKLELDNEDKFKAAIGLLSLKSIDQNIKLKSIKVITSPILDDKVETISLLNFAALNQLLSNSAVDKALLPQVIKDFSTLKSIP